MPGPALALLASLSWGVADFLAGLAGRRLPLLTVLVVSQAFGLASIAAVVAARAEGPPTARYLLYAVLGGLAATVGIAAFYRALAVGTMSVIAPITATAVIVPVVVGVARGERPGVLQTLGIGLALVGVVLASRERGRIAGTGVGLALVAAVALGLVLVALDAAGEGDALWSTLILRSTTFALFVLAAAATRPARALGPRDLRALAVIGVLDTAGNALFAVAATEGLLSVIAVLAQLFPIVTVFLARVLLGERLTGLQRVGVVAALGGVGLITAS